MTLCVLLSVGPMLVPAPAAADDYPRREGLDVAHYRFELTLYDDEPRVSGRATISVDVGDAGVDALLLDLVGREAAAAADDAGAPDDGSAPEGMAVEAVRVDGRPAVFTHRDAQLRVALDPPPAPGTRLEVVVDYGGVPRDGLGAGPNRHGVWSWFSDNWPNKARHWLPTVDHPYDKATSEMLVTAPDRVQVVSNGLLVEERDLGDGRRLTHWRQGVPIATWLFTVGVTEFAVQHLPAFRGIPVQTWVFAQDRDAGFHDFAEPTHHVLEFYSDHIGPYPYEKLANVQSARTRGGMEAATALMYDDRSVTGTRSKRWRNVVIHEIAHQWFGNAITEADWDDVWLSEGFATYFTLLFIEHAYGRDEFVDGLIASRERILGYAAEDPGHTIVHDDLDDMSRVTTGNTYQKGAWTLHMLRALVGDEAFWRGIRAYYRAYRDRNNTTADFRREMERASGLDLRGFLDQWLRRPGLPVLAWSSSFDPASCRAVVEVRQTQDGPPFELRLPIGFHTVDEESGERRDRVEILDLQERSRRLEIETCAEPLGIALDPRTEVLHDVTTD